VCDFDSLDANVGGSVRLTYSLTAPLSIPEMKWRCRKR
jgi:hypothetical protein